MKINELKAQNLILFEAVSGRCAFGLATKTSDTDIKGVYYLPKNKFLRLEYVPQVSNQTNDIVYYELGKFIEYLLKNNPNLLELLASPEECVLYRHPVMDQIRLSDFLSKLCKDSFAGYAMTQIKKARGLNKKMSNPMDKTRKTILDFCYILKDYDSITLNQWLENNNYIQENCGLVSISHFKGLYALFYEAYNAVGYKGIMQNNSANEVLVSNIPKGKTQAAYLSFNQEAYSLYCKEYKEYWEWIENRNADRFRTNQNHGYNYDSKNMMHTIRLLESAQQIFTTGKLTVKVQNRDELLAIKAGNFAYEVLLEKAENLLQAIENQYIISELQQMPDTIKTEQMLVSIRNELYFSN